MKITELRSESFNKEFKIQVPFVDINAQVEKKVLEAAKTFRMPGFREGKVASGGGSDPYSASPLVAPAGLTITATTSHRLVPTPTPSTETPTCARCACAFICLCSACSRVYDGRGPIHCAAVVAHGCCPMP